MNKVITYIDDWNTLFRKIPKTINDRTYEIMCGSNNCIDLDGYMNLKSKLAILMNDVGKFEYINHLTGDQTIVNAVVIAMKYLEIKNVYVMRDAFHGITLKSFRDKIINPGNILITELEIDFFDSMCVTFNENSLLILEPFLFFAKYGNEGIEIIRTIVSVAKSKRAFILFDEVRSGAFCTGTFLFTQQCFPIDVDFICFSKGLALGVPTSVLAIKEGIFSKNIIKKEDQLKSCMSNSEIAMQRSNDLLEYYLNNIEYFNRKMFCVTEKIKDCFSPFVKFSSVRQVNIVGLCCVFVFDENVKKSKLKFLWLYLLSKNIEARHNEENLWFMNFALDTTDKELFIVKNALLEAFQLCLLN